MQARWLTTVVLFGSVASAGPAWSTAIVHTSANSGIESSSVDTSQIPNLANEPYVSSVSHASELSASSTAAAGLVTTCFNAPASHCAIVGTDRLVNTFASANGNNGTLKAGVHTYIDNSLGGGNTQGSAMARLVDTITLTSPVIKVSLDVTSFMTNHTGGDANFGFRFGFADPTPENLEDQGGRILFSLEGFRDETGLNLEQGYIAYLLGEPENEFASGNSVPGVFTFIIDLSDPAFAELFTPIAPGFPSPYDLNGPNQLEFALIAEARCDHDPCSATSRLEETLYIELEGESASGYSYPGRQIVEPPTGIPEPATALILLAGITGLAAGKRWHQPCTE